jgi:hypothetical protein
LPALDMPPLPDEGASLALTNFSPHASGKNANAKAVTSGTARRLPNSDLKAFSLASEIWAVK